MCNKRSLILFFIILATMLACRNETVEKEKIASIEFEKNRVELAIGEELTIRVTAKPAGAKKNELIEYKSVNEGIIELREATNDGFVVKGIRGGSTVITATSEDVTSYCEVIVLSDAIVTQYITVAQPVIEMWEGERRTTQVSLYNGSVLDNNDFTWRLENGKDNIGIDTTGNIAVISALARGYQKIIVSHPKAEYESEILVFVQGADDALPYISSDSNVFLVPLNGQYHTFSVLLVNGQAGDNGSFIYEIVDDDDDGNKYFELVPHENMGNVKGIKAGSSLIRITHPKAEVAFDLRVIVYATSIPFITLDKTFVLMSIGESATIVADIENTQNEVAARSQFSHEVIEETAGVVEVVRTNNSFYVRARKGGDARIVVSNDQAETDREILIVVRDEVVYRDDYYITTSQNVIMTQVGASEIQLNMQLVNGNTADANNFEWVVDDGTVVDVESIHGKVNYNSRATINSVFNAIALVTPKKSGTAKITLSHSKTESVTTVMVKVYPKGTFAEIPVVVGAKNADGSTKGLFTVVIGQPETVQLAMVSGDVSDVGTLSWATGDPGIASVPSGVTGMNSILTAHSNGLTKLTVNGSKLESPYEALVLAGSAEYIDNTSVIYVDSFSQKLLTDQTVTIPVKDSQDKYGNSSDFTAVVENSDLLYAVMVKNQLVMQGKGVGETKVKITHKDATNDITVNVRIDSATVSVDTPFYLNGPDMVGLVRGVQTEIAVSLVGADASEYGKMVWSIDDSSVASVLANGTTAQINGRVSNTQTKIRVNHPKSQNERVILIYVVETENDLYDKVVIGVAEEHYLLTQGDSKLVTLITNASDEKKLGLVWSVKYGNDIVAVESNYDSAMLRAMNAGNAEIVVSHTNNLLPVSIYVSVVDAVYGEKTIKGPASIELLTGESKIVSVSHLNLSQSEISNIRWSIEDSSIANIEGNGDSAYIYGLKKGVSYVNIRQDQIGYQHRVTLVCANTPEELASMYIMGVNDSYHVMTVGDEKRIQLTFGSGGFPETAKTQIQWTPSNNGVVRVSGSGDVATVVAANAGTGTVKVQSDTSFNELELTFEVRNVAANIGVYEFRNYDKIIGMVVGEPERRVTLRLYDGNTEITHGYSLISHENEYDGIVAVNRVDNILSLTAKSAGQSYITVRHSQVNDAARILVYTANTQAELDAYYPIVADKTHYLLQVGEQATVRITTLTEKDNENNNLANIQWGIENSSIIESPVYNGKKEAVIKGRSPGQCIINITHQGSVVEKIYVTVVSNDTVDMTKYIVTESIIGIEKGKSRQTKIVTNLESADINKLLWETTNSDLIMVSGSGDTATITAKNPSGNINEAYVTVSHGSWLKRHILVYLCDSEAEIQNYRAMNMDNQYIRLGRNEQVTLSNFYAPNKSSTATVWADKYDNKVVRFNSQESGAKLEITTLNEGVAVLEAMNTGVSNSSRVMQIYIEVSDRYSNANNGVNTITPDVRYLTTGKNIYVLNPDEKDVYVDASVNGIGMTIDELNKVKWEIVEGHSLINIYPNGSTCTVGLGPAGAEGNARIRAYYVDNEVVITIVISRTGIVGYPHIVGDDVVRLGLQDKRTVEYSIAEAAAYENSAFDYTIVSGHNVIDVSRAGNMFEITGKAAGQALLKVSHPAASFAKEVVVIVTTTPDGILYLTTRDNFSVVKTGDYSTLNVSFVGMDNPGDGGYVWKVESGGNYITLNSTGSQAQVLGVQAGTAKIVVTHEYIDPRYSLTMYVRVTELEIQPVYITTSKNIVVVTEGQSAYLDAELVNGSASDNALFVWTSNSTAIAMVAGAGNQAVVTGKSVGTARVTITNAATYPANYAIDILIVVEADTTDNSIYITSGTSLLDMKPNETRQVSAQLVGGTTQDVYGLTWQAVDHVSITKNANGTNRNVIRVDGTGGSVMVTALEEGEATIQITHVKSSYVLQIKVYIRLYDAIRFAQRNVSVNAGSTVYVNVEAPSGVQVYYSSSNTNFATVSGTNSTVIITGKSAGICIVSAYNAQGTMSDEIIVEVKAVENQLVRYIQTPEIIYNMTNLQSALNRATITGKAVGDKASGGTFSDADNDNIRWRVSSGSSVIGLEQSAGTVVTITEKNEKIQYIQASAVNVYTTGNVGTAEIQLTHQEMAEYTKTLHVNVSLYDADFGITPMNTVTEKNQTVDLMAVLTDIANRNYNDVSWTIKPNSDGEHGLEFIDSSTGDVLSEKTMTGEKVKVRILEENAWMVEASYRGKTIGAMVYAQPEKKLEITTATENGVINLTPGIGQEETIRYTILPSGHTPDLKMDWGEYLEVIEGPVTNGTSGYFVVRGKEREGYTQITLTSGGIERVVTVHTNKERRFHMMGVVKNGVLEPASAVRGKPGETVVVQYEIYPIGDAVSYKEGGYEQDYPFAAIVGLGTNIGINKDTQQITLKLQQCGNTKIYFESEYNKTVGVDLEIPVYVFYEDLLSLTWSATATRVSGRDGKPQSRMDVAQQAIYIADGDMVTITFTAKETNSNIKLGGATPPNLDTSITITTNTSVNTVTVTNRFEGKTSGTGTANITSTDYVGLLTIPYSYFTGGENASSFSKLFLIYKETWAR